MMCPLAQHAASGALLHQQDHGPVEGQVGGDGPQALVQQLVQVKGGAEGQADLVQRGQLGQSLIERDVRELQVRVGLLEVVKLLLGVVAGLQQQAFRLLWPSASLLERHRSQPPAAGSRAVAAAAHSQPGSRASV